MKKTKKLIGLLMVCVFALSCSIMTFAANDVPVLTLESNEYNSNGERHIKLTWEGQSGTYQIQLDDDKDFGSPMKKTRTNRQGKYYNFVLADNVDATYYARVRLGNGEWSNVVVASLNNQVESSSTPYFSIPKVPTIPDVSGSVKVPSISFGNFNFSFWNK